MSTAESFINVMERYFGESMFLAAFFLSLVLFYWKSEGKVRDCLIAVCFGVFCFLNPISFRVIRALGEGETYYRLLWMVPILLGVGYLCIEILETAKKKYQKRLIAGMMIGFLVVNGNQVLMKIPELPSNIYQIDDDVIQLADAMDELSGGKRVDFLSNGTIEDLIRQYNANICLFMNGTHEVNLMIVNEWTHYGGSYVRQKIAYLHPEYIAIKKETPNVVHFLKSSGLAVCAESENYYLFDVKPDELLEDNAYLASFTKEKITAINVEYLELPKSDSEYEFLYVTNLFSEYDKQRIEEVIMIARELEVDALIISDDRTPNAVSQAEAVRSLEEAGIPFVYNQGEQNTLEFSDLFVCTAENAEGTISESEFTLVKEALEAQKTVLLATDQLMNVNTGQGFEGELANIAVEQGTILQNYARGDLWQKTILQEHVYGFTQNEAHSHMVTLVRVRGSEE